LGFVLDMKIYDYRFSVYMVRIVTHIYIPRVKFFYMNNDRSRYTNTLGLFCCNTASESSGDLHGRQFAKTSPTDHLNEGPATTPPGPDPGKMIVSHTVFVGRCKQPRWSLRPLRAQAPPDEEGGGRPTDRLIKCQRLICVCR